MGNNLLSKILQNMEDFFVSPCALGFLYILSDI